MSESIPEKFEFIRTLPVGYVSGLNPGLGAALSSAMSDGDFKRIKKNRSKSILAVYDRIDRETAPSAPA